MKSKSFSPWTKKKDENDWKIFCCAFLSNKLWDWERKKLLKCQLF